MGCGLRRAVGCCGFCAAIDAGDYMSASTGVLLWMIEAMAKIQLTCSRKASVAVFMCWLEPAI